MSDWISMDGTVTVRRNARMSLRDICTGACLSHGLECVYNQLSVTITGAFITTKFNFSVEETVAEHGIEVAQKIIRGIRDFDPKAKIRIRAEIVFT